MIFTVKGSPTNISLRNQKHLKPETVRNQMMQRTYWGCTMMINRSLRDLALPMPESIKGHDCWSGLLGISTGISKTIGPTLQYRRHDGGVTAVHESKTHRLTKHLHYTAGIVSEVALARKRITERLGEKAVPTEMDEFLTIVEGPAALRAARLIAGGFTARKLHATAASYAAIIAFSPSTANVR